MANPTIYYVRHGQTDWNAELRFQGQQDIPLNAKGQGQANANGKKLAGLLGNGEGLLFIASPLGRARETMERVRTEMALDPKDYQVDEQLKEISFGDLEGTTQPEMKAGNRELYYQRKQNPWTFRPLNGESHEDALARVKAWHESLTQDCVVAAHGAIGRILRIHLLDLDVEDPLNSRFSFPQDEVCIIRKGEEKWL